MLRYAFDCGPPRIYCPRRGEPAISASAAKQESADVDVQDEHGEALALRIEMRICRDVAHSSIRLLCDLCRTGASPPAPDIAEVPRSCIPLSSFPADFEPFH
jgi:hypothetical protein